MKIEYRDNKLIVFFNNKILNIDKLNIDRQIKDIFSKLDKIYNIDLDGCYDVEVYIDNNIGCVLSIVKDNLDYYDYDLVDVNVNISKYGKFVFKVNDIYDFGFRCSYYLYKGGLYVLPISFGNVGYLFENGEVIYGEIVNDVIEKGTKIIV